MGDWRDEIAREERVHPPVHPGEVLRHEWLEPLDVNPNQLVKALGVDRQSTYEIVAMERSVSANMALRLARWSGMRPAFWLGLQAEHDLQVAEWKRGREIAE